MTLFLPSFLISILILLILLINPINLIIVLLDFVLNWLPIELVNIFKNMFNIALSLCQKMIQSKLLLLFITNNESICLWVLPYFLSLWNLCDFDNLWHYLFSFLLYYYYKFFIKLLYFNNFCRFLFWIKLHHFNKMIIGWNYLKL